jgi:hypothetical protein
LSTVPAGAGRRRARLIRKRCRAAGDGDEPTRWLGQVASIRYFILAVSERN